MTVPLYIRDPLGLCLIDLADRLAGLDIPLVVGGGYGLFLKQEDLMTRGVDDTLVPRHRWSPARSTEDIDIFLRAEIVGNSGSFRAIRNALIQMGFEPSPAARNMHWIRSEGWGGSIKIDFLSGASSTLDPTRVKIKAPRVQPRGSDGLHAHLAEEVLELDGVLPRLVLDREMDGRRDAPVVVHLPHAFDWILMKVAAFADRKLFAENQFARHHAVDLYRILAMMVRTEAIEAGVLYFRHAANPAVTRARRVVAEDFGSDTALGCLRILEAGWDVSPMEMRLFRETLSGILSAQGKSPAE